jgi:hypothetical protein
MSFMCGAAQAFFNTSKTTNSVLEQVDNAVQPYKVSDAKANEPAKSGTLIPIAESNAMN